MDQWWLRFGHNMAGRLDGPLHLRFILQPLMSGLFALRDGVHDAQRREPAYFWSLFTDSGRRTVRLKEGWRSIGRIFVLALLIDAIYQIITLRHFYTGEAVITASLLAIVPYILLRGPVNRVAKILLADRRAHQRLRSARL